MPPSMSALRSSRVAWIFGRNFFQKIRPTITKMTADQKMS
jgi:hypothetical protein